MERVSSVLIGLVRWVERSELSLLDECAAISVGVVGGVPMLDLAYVEDSTADTDMNVVCTSDGGFVEVQGTAEGAVFDRAMLDRLLDLAVAGCKPEAGEWLQQATLAGPPPAAPPARSR